MNTPPDAVLIAGGGIGGLACALALARRGIASHVLEKRGSFSEDGAGIQIGPNGSRILQSLGAAPFLAPAACAPDAIQVRDAVTGVQIARLPLGAWIAARHGAPYLTAHRKDLHAALLEAAGHETLITLSTNAGVTGCVEELGGVRADLEAGGERHGRALIAADGLWSALRAGWAAGGDLRPSGKVALRTVVSAGHLPAGLAANDVHIWLTVGAHVVHYPVRGASEHAFVIVIDDASLTEGWSTRVEPAFVKARTRSLAPSLRALLDSADTWRMWSLQELALPKCWVSGRRALLGDAAHPVLPFLAQGAVLALEDAVVLADELAHAGRGEIAVALLAYQERRRPRALRVQAASRRNGQIYHLNGMLALMRDSVLRATPPALLMRQYDWLYGWRA